MLKLRLQVQSAKADAVCVQAVPVHHADFIKMRLLNFSHKKSFTLIEVLIFVTIVSLFFVTASAVAVVALQNSKSSEHKILATKYAEELIEWLRSESESGWAEFTDSNHTASCGSMNKCFASLDWTSGECGATCNTKIASLFTRAAGFQLVGDSQVNATVNLSWNELGKSYTVTIKTLFSLLE